MNDSFLALRPDQRDTVWTHGLIGGFAVAMKTTWCKLGPTLLVQASHGCNDPALFQESLHLPPELERLQTDELINIEVDRRIAWLTLYPASAWEELESEALDRVLRDFLETLERNGFSSSETCHLCGEGADLEVVFQGDRVALACRDCTRDFPYPERGAPRSAENAGWRNCVAMGLLGALSGAVLWQLVSIGLYLALGSASAHLFVLCRWAVLSLALAAGFCIGWPVGHQISRVSERGRTAAKRSALLCMLPGVALGEFLYGQWLVQHLGLQPGIASSLRAAMGSDVSDVFLLLMKVGAFVFAVCVARDTAAPGRKRR